MKNKETIKLHLSRESAAESDILIAKPNESSYVDEHFFRNVMKEAAPNSKMALTYATKMNVIRADWIVQKDEGYRFLSELYR
jgi:hypothetical protein